MTDVMFSLRSAKPLQRIPLCARNPNRTQSDRQRLGSVTLARSRVRVRAEYEFVSCRHHRNQRTGSVRITPFVSIESVRESAERKRRHAESCPLHTHTRTDTQIHTYPAYSIDDKHPIPIQELRAEEGGGLTSWAYNTYYTA